MFNLSPKKGGLSTSRSFLGQCPDTRGQSCCSKEDELKWFSGRAPFIPYLNLTCGQIWSHSHTIGSRPSFLAPPAADHRCGWDKNCALGEFSLAVVCGGKLSWHFVRSLLGLLSGWVYLPQLQGGNSQWELHAALYLHGVFCAPSTNAVTKIVHTVGEVTFLK